MPFSPFTDNGGTTVAIAGNDFCLIAGDTRQSQGYEINSRYQPHTFQLNPTTVLSACGMYADTVALVRHVTTRMTWYKFQHAKEMSIGAVAQMVATMLYQKRFFPYYVFTVLGGVDSNGNGVVYSFDPVGSYEPHVCRAGGSAASLIQPFLDNQIMRKNMANRTPLKEPSALSSKRLAEGGLAELERPTLDEAMKVCKDAFTSATERDIHTGDYLELFVVKRGQGVQVLKYDLKKD